VSRSRPRTSGRERARSRWLPSTHAAPRRGRDGKARAGRPVATRTSLLDLASPICDDLRTLRASLW